MAKGGEFNTKFSDLNFRNNNNIHGYVMQPGLRLEGLRRALHFFSKNGFDFLF